MLNSSFSERHPWLIRKLKIFFWKSYKFLGIRSFSYRLQGNNQKINLKTTDNSVSKSIFLDNYENETINFCSRFIEPGDVVFDVGANIGYFTLLFSSYVGDKGKVHSFEPSSREFLQLNKNIQMNKLKNVISNQLALGNYVGLKQLNVLDDEKYGAFNSFNELSHHTVMSQSTHIELVKMMTMDQYMEATSGIFPSLIKIDVEGFELQVLEGMESLLSCKNSPCLIFEVCEETHKQLNETIQDLLEYLLKFHYEFFGSHTGGDLVPFNPSKHLNCVAIKQAHLSRIHNKKIEISISH